MFSRNSHWGFALLLAVTFSTQAVAWPEQTIRLKVGYPAGGAVDAVARILADELQKELNTAVIVENRPGASGSVAANEVAKSSADGYTLLVASPSEVLISRISGQTLPYSPERDLLPISLVGELQLAIVARPNFAAKSMKALLMSKDKEVTNTFGTPGIATPMHYAGELFSLRSGVKMLHVPFRGAAPALTDLLGAHIDLGILGLSVVLPYVKSKQLIPMAIAGNKRVEPLPDVPAMSEFEGFGDFRFTNWIGLFAPAGTPNSVTAVLSAAVAKILASEAVKAKLLIQGIDPIGSSGNEFSTFLESERVRYTDIAKVRGIQIGGGK